MELPHEYWRHRTSFKIANAIDTLLSRDEFKKLRIRTLCTHPISITIGIGLREPTSYSLQIFLRKLVITNSIENFLHIY
jgi:hypothetical protein